MATAVVRDFVESVELKRTLDATAEELVCAITMALPIDPVTAQDGHVYERAAVEEWITKGNGKSPKTNEPMGPALLPAPQVKAMIRGMVESGALTGDKAQAWEAKLAGEVDEDEAQATREEAEGGCAVAMYNLGDWYLDGSRGLRQDGAEAIRWFQRSADAGDADGLSLLGHCLCNGMGVAQNERLGLTYLTSGAERGSEYGCFLLGECFASGLHGLPQDAKQATAWFRRMQGSETGTAPADAWEKADAWLSEHATDYWVD
jgi:TPR repeat protein